MSEPGGKAEQRRSGLTRGELTLLHAATVAVAGSGLVYAVLRYLVRPDDPYAVVNHPWQPHAQHLHVVVAPLLVLALGMVWRAHAAAARSRPERARRRSGAVLIVAALPMVLSGALIQVATVPSWRSAWVGVHLTFSVAWLVAFVAHLVGRRSVNSGGSRSE